MKTTVAIPHRRSPRSRSRKKVQVQQRKKTANRSRKELPGLGEKEICRIVALRNRHAGIPVGRIRELYRESFGSPPSERIIQRIIRSCGIQDPVARSWEIAGGIVPAAEANAPNDVWTVEFKSGWHSRTGLPEPIIVRDEATRFVIAARMLPDSMAGTMSNFFEDLFVSFGLPRVICCPQSSPFGFGKSLLGFTKLTAYWLAQGIGLEWKRPGHMREPSWIERPRMQLGFAWRLQSPDERQMELNRWRENFNISPSPVLQGSAPCDLFPSKAPCPREPVTRLHYDGLDYRHVGRKGCIRVKGRSCFLSTAFSGWDVALVPQEDQGLEIHFARVSLGVLDTESFEFLPWGTPRIPANQTSTSHEK